MNLNDKTLELESVFLNTHLIGTATPLPTELYLKDQAVAIQHHRGMRIPCKW